METHPSERTPASTPTEESMGAATLAALATGLPAAESGKRSSPGSAMYVQDGEALNRICKLIDDITKSRRRLPDDLKLSLYDFLRKDRAGKGASAANDDAVTKIIALLGKIAVSQNRPVADLKAILWGFLNDGMNRSAPRDSAALVAPAPPADDPARLPPPVASGAVGDAKPAESPQNGDEVPAGDVVADGAATVKGEASVPAAPQAEPTQNLAIAQPVLSPPPAALDTTQLINDAIADVDTAAVKDRRELEASTKEMGQWQKIITALRRAIEPAISQCGEMIQRAGETFKALPPELRDKLHGQNDGLELVGKMAARLRDKLPADGALMESSLPTITREDWTGLLAGQTGEPAARILVRDKLRAISHERFQFLSRVRGMADGQRKGFINFTKKHLILVIDGLDDGERYSQALVEELRAAHPDAAAGLDMWWRTYSGVRTLLLAALKLVGVRPIEVNVGSPVDYERHEPFDVEADPKMPNESVKSVTRRGYEYVSGTSGEGPVVIRPAQVIVVRN